jgi:hypothetical protein
LPDEQQQRLLAAGLWPLWEALRGQYVHHYPICVRKVLPDDTLLSMASGNQPRYAISLISYAAPQRREGFFRAMELLANAMAELFQARPHWGKHCPLNAARWRTLYPRWDEFRQMLLERDPQHAFANDWLADLFQLRDDNRHPGP